MITAATPYKSATCANLQQTGYDLGTRQQKNCRKMVLFSGTNRLISARSTSSAPRSLSRPWKRPHLTCESERWQFLKSQVTLNRHYFIHESAFTFCVFKHAFPILCNNFTFWISNSFGILETNLSYENNTLKSFIYVDKFHPT